MFSLIDKDRACHFLFSIESLEKRREIFCEMQKTEELVVKFHLSLHTNFIKSEAWILINTCNAKWCNILNALVVSSANIWLSVDPSLHVL